MRRERKVKPEFFTSPDVTSLPVEVRLTFIGLLLYVDDYGNGYANAGLIKAAVYPLEPDITTDVVDEHLLQLAERDMVTFYSAGGRQLLRITNWSRHQRVDKPSKSNIPVDPARETPAKEERARVGSEGEASASSDGTEEGGEEWAEPGEGERAQSRPDPDTARDDRPDPFCRKHMPEGTDKPCGPCGTARVALKEWKRRNGED